MARSLLRASTLTFLIPAMLAAAGTAAQAQDAAVSQPPAAPFAACPDSATASDNVETPCLAIVDFNDELNPMERAGVIRRAGAVMRFGFGVMNAAATMVPNIDAYWSLALDPAVTRVFPDIPVRAIAPPGACDPWPSCKDGSTVEEPVPSETLGSGLVRIGADAAWQASRGDNVLVAILDTGLDTDHPDLAGKIVPGANCLGDTGPHGCISGNEDDNNGHGTHVGGIVAAIEGNGLDVAGVAPDAKLVGVKVLDGNGSGYTSNIIAGLEWVRDNSAARVVNMSLGGDGDCASDSAEPILTAIQSAIGAGISVVVAAGNDRTQEISDTIPAGCTGVIAVASTSAEDGQNKCKRLPDYIRADTASFFTTDGQGVVSAPGIAREDNNCATIQPEGILSLAAGGGTTRMYGTSMAAPHVAGVAALMLSVNSSLSPGEVRLRIRNSSSRIDDAPLIHPYVTQSYDGEREGIVDAVAAVAAAGSP